MNLWILTSVSHKGSLQNEMIYIFVNMILNRSQNLFNQNRSLCVLLVLHKLECGRNLYSEDLAVSS